MDSLQEFFISMAIQILYYTVIRQDLKLIIRKKDREETVEFFLSGVAFLFFPALSSNLDSRGTAVVPISNIGTGQLLK